MLHTVPAQHLIKHAGALACALAPDGDCVVSAGLSMVALWEYGTWRPIWSTKIADEIFGVSFSPSGRIVSVACEGTVLCLSAADGSTKVRLAGPKRYIFRAVVDEADEFVVSAGDDRTVRLWDLSTGAQVSLFKAHKKAVLDVAFATGAKRFISVSADGQVMAWSTKNRAPDWATQVSTLPLTSCAVVGGLVLTAGTSRELCLLDVDSGVVRRKLPVAGADAARCAQFDNNTAVIGTKGQVQLVRLADGSVERELLGPTSVVWDLSSAPAERRVACASDGVFVWSDV